MQTTTLIRPRSAHNSKPGIAHRMSTIVQPIDVAGNPVPLWTASKPKRIYFEKRWSSIRVNYPLFLYLEQIPQEMLTSAPAVLRDDPHIYWLWASLVDPSQVYGREMTHWDHLMQNSGIDLDEEKLHVITETCPIEIKMKRPPDAPKKSEANTWVPNMIQTDLRAGDIAHGSELAPNFRQKIISRRITSTLSISTQEGWIGAWHRLG